MACLFLLLIFGAPAGAAPATPQLAVVIDDIGYSLKLGQTAVDLPATVSLALLPYAPNSLTLARRAAAAGKEIILHQPMQAETRTRVERGTLTLNMDHQAFVDQLSRALITLPNVVGVSNHTGSELTRHAEPMGWLMAQIGDRGLFFLDSRTTTETVASRTARLWHVPVLERDVFLDHQHTPAAMLRALDRAVTLALRQGHAVLIAHPYPDSLRLLEETLPRIADTGEVELVTAGTLARRLSPRPAALGLR